MNAVQSSKAALRKHMRGVLGSMTESDRQQQSGLVTTALLGAPLYQDAKRVSVYLSMKDEINTMAIVEHCLTTGKECFIPRYDGKSRHMDMVRLTSMADYEGLPVTSWQIKQPPLNQEREEALTSGGLDLILVPGMAFSRRGDRLGRGKGYYDTFLSKCLEVCSPTLLALAFTQQVLTELPTDSTDIRVSHLLTADGGLLSTS